MPQRGHIRTFYVRSSIYYFFFFSCQESDRKTFTLFFCAVFYPHIWGHISVVLVVHIVSVHHQQAHAWLGLVWGGHSRKTASRRQLEFCSFLMSPKLGPNLLNFGKTFRVSSQWPPWTLCCFFSELCFFNSESFVNRIVFFFMLGAWSLIS